MVRTVRMNDEVDNMKELVFPYSSPFQIATIQSKGYGSEFNEFETLDSNSNTLSSDSVSTYPRYFSKNQTSDQNCQVVTRWSVCDPCFKQKFTISHTEVIRLSWHTYLSSYAYP